MQMQEKKEQQPSYNQHCAYLFFPQECNQTDGKWLLFYPKGQELDSMWSFLITSNIVQFEGVCFLKVTTARPHSHARDQKIGVIMVFVAPNLSKMAIINIGKQLINITGYTSTFGKMFYKSSNYTFSLPVALPPPKKLSNHDDDDVEMKTSTTFAVPHSGTDFAQKLGAVWNAQFKQWCAPNNEVWEKLTLYFKQQDEQHQQQELQKISCYSMNVWMSPVFRLERMFAIFESISQYNPDLVCLQEVVADSLNIIDSLLRSIGFATRSCLHSCKKFGEMLYYNTKTIEILGFEQQAFPESTMNRELHILRALHKTTNTKFACGTAHLECGQNRKELRLRQMTYVITLLNAQHLPWIFGGDTNLCYYQDFKLPIKIQDAWEQTGQDDCKRGTWDPRRNTNLRHIGQHVGKCRFDRILFDTTQLQAVRFELTCQERLGLIGIHASDHFGIFAVLQVT